MIANPLYRALHVFVLSVGATGLAMAQAAPEPAEPLSTESYEAPPVPNLRPDFRLEQMQVKRKNESGRGFWVIRILVRNIGANWGLNRIEDTVPVTFHIRECLASGPDYGSSDFVCANPRVRSIHRTIPTPRFGEVSFLATGLFLRYPHDVYVTVNEPGNGMLGSYVEQDYPTLSNNQTLVQIIWDSKRPACEPCPWVWTWPNVADMLPDSIPQTSTRNEMKD